MKIIETQDVPKFKPVKVVFESQEEIDYIAALLSASRQQIADELSICLDTSVLWEQFRKITKLPMFFAPEKISVKRNSQQF